MCVRDGEVSIFGHVCFSIFLYLCYLTVNTVNGHRQAQGCSCSYGDTQVLGALTAKHQEIPEHKRASWFGTFLFNHVWKLI